MGKRDAAKILLPSSRDKSSSGKCIARFPPPYKGAKKKHSPLFPPVPPYGAPTPAAGQKLQLFFLSFFFRSWGWEPGKEGVEKRRCWGEKSPSGEKLRNLWRGKKGEGERETSVAGKEAGAAFIITGLDTTFSREGRREGDSTAFPAPSVWQEPISRRRRNFPLCSLLPSFSAHTVGEDVLYA